MHSPALASFQDPFGMPFVCDCGQELRLVWALCVDWYNLYKNKATGKLASTGVIAMICLSLPPMLWTKEHNTYLTRNIPGPKKPSVNATNNFLDPVVDKLGESC